jgi:hypothetical protein
MLPGAVMSTGTTGIYSQTYGSRGGYVPANGVLEEKSA